MQKICHFQITIQGQVDAKELNATSPLQIEIKRTGLNSTQLIVCTDQSGLIGLIRYLHGMGFVFLSIVRKNKG